MRSHLFTQKIILRIIFLLWLISGSSIVWGQSKISGSIESWIEVEDEVFFDYRLHRNPAYIFKTDILNRPEAKDKSWHYLFNGQVVASYREGKFVNEKVHAWYQPKYKLDIQIEPLFLYVLGNFNDPFQSQIGLSPMINFVPTKGLYVVAQWNFPIQNDFSETFGLQHRPGQIGMGYDHFINPRQIVSTYVGTFTGNQYGFQLEYLGQSKNHQWYYGGSLFRSGDFYYDDMWLYRGYLDTWSAYVQLAWRIPVWDLTMRWIGDWYLNHDKGMTMEVTRQYGNTDIGFYAIAAQNATNAGFYARLRLWPQKFYTNNWMQVRLPHTYDWYYNVRSVSNTPRVRNYRSLFGEMLRFNPNFLNQQLLMKQ